MIETTERPPLTPRTDPMCEHEHALARPHVDPTACMTYDWVHNCLQDGVFTVEVQLLLTACSEFGLAKTQIRSDLKDTAWEFPSQTRQKAKQLHRIFDPYREVSDDQHRLKCSASELLGLYEILRYIIAARVPRDIPDLSPKIASFDAACNVLDTLVSAKRGCAQMHMAARDLQRAMCRHLDLHIAAYGTGSVRPKHHWNLDIPGQIVRDQLIIDMFIIERLHLKVKAVAEPIKNTSQFERSLLAGVLNYSMKPASDNASWSHALLGSVRSVGNGVFASPKMRVHGLQIEVGDIVVASDRCGLVLSCLLIGSILHVAVEALAREGVHTNHWGLWRPSSTCEVWVASEVRQCVAWKPAAGGATLVLL